MKSRLKIAERMAVGFGLMMVVLVIFAWVIDRRAQKIEAARRELTTRIAPLREAADAVQLRFLNAAIGVRAWLVDPTPEALLRLRQQVVEARAALLALELMQREPDGEAVFQKARPLLEAYLVECQRFVERGQASANEASEQALTAHREEALAALNEFIKLQRNKRDHALIAIQQASNDAEQGTKAAVALALVLFLLLAVLTVHSVREPARRLVEVARHMERGDWRTAVELASVPGDRTARDELGILRHAFVSAATALERREQRLKTDMLVARAAGSGLSREGIAQPALDAICAQLQAELGVLFRAEGAQLVPVATKGLTATPVKVGEGLAGRAALERRPQLLTDSLGPEWVVRRGLQTVPAQNVLAVPIISRDEVLAVVVIGSLAKLGAEAVSFLEVSATQLAVGLQNVASHEQIKKLVAELGRQGEQIQAQNEALQVQNEELQVQGEEIRTQNEELQAQSEEIKAQNDELSLATARLRGQAEVLVEEDERKTEFLGVLAHELRNPLAAISNSLFALTHARDNPAMRERAEQVIGRQTRLLSRLIEDLLDVTRINSGKIRIDREVVDLAAVLRAAVEDCKGAAERAGTRVELQLPADQALVEGDPVRLQQVMGNLIDNAIKFGGDQQPVRVSLEVNDDRSTEVKVCDDGEGIEASVLKRLFVPFSQADTSVQRHRSGLGLGLALVKALVELHGGTVKAFSAGLGRGAEFSVHFPSPTGRGSG
jgi:signal transduction histidine kinase